MVYGKACFHSYDCTDQVTTINPDSITELLYITTLHRLLRKAIQLTGREILLRNWKQLSKYSVTQIISGMV